MKIQLNLQWVERENGCGAVQAYPLMTASIDISESELKFIKKQGRAELDRASEAFQSLMSVIRHIGGFVSRGAQSDI